MKLLTKAILDKLPLLYSTEKTPTEEKLVVCKFFFPIGRYTYYAVEYDPEDKVFFGFCVSPLGPDCDEWGYTSLEELEALKVKGLGIERDLYFKAAKFGELRQIEPYLKG